MNDEEGCREVPIGQIGDCEPRRNSIRSRGVRVDLTISRHPSIPPSPPPSPASDIKHSDHEVVLDHRFCARYCARCPCRRQLDGHRPVHHPECHRQSVDHALSAPGDLADSSATDSIDFQAIPNVNLTDILNNIGDTLASAPDPPTGSRRWLGARTVFTNITDVHGQCHPCLPVTQAY
jgi:hypothetical protein